MSELLPVLTEILAALKLGPIAMAGSLLLLLLRVYRSSFVQSILPNRVRWDSLSQWAKFLLPFLLSLAGSFLVAVSGGATVLSALSLGFSAAIAAVGGHHATKAIGQGMTNTALKKLGPAYEPSLVRRATSLLLPVGKLPSDVFDRTP
jgi:hypothetical protein